MSPTINPERFGKRHEVAHKVRRLLRAAHKTTMIGLTANEAAILANEDVYTVSQLLTKWAQAGLAVRIGEVERGDEKVLAYIWNYNAKGKS